MCLLCVERCLHILSAVAGHEVMLTHTTLQNEVCKQELFHEMGDAKIKKTSSQGSFSGYFSNLLCHVLEKNLQKSQPKCRFVKPLHMKSG